MNHPRYPRLYGTYELLESLGKGGMSEVELARRAVKEEAFIRFLVIKRIQSRHAADVGFVRMFQDEARISAELQHENIAQVYDFGQVDDEYFIAMEYIPGMDLREVQRALARNNQKVPLRVALTVLAHVASALHYAHSRVDTFGRPMRIVHRDVNPRNVMLSVRGEVKLIDFGVAKAENRSESTVGHSLKGKFAYMAPEQIDGSVRIDGRADVFALGLMVQELIEGTSPFVGLSDVQIMHKVLMGGVPALSLRGDEFPLPELLHELHARAVARDRDQRYPDALAMRADLVRAADVIGGLCDRTELADFLRRVDPEAADGINQRLRTWRENTTSFPDKTLSDVYPGPAAPPEDASISRSVQSATTTRAVAVGTAGVVAGGVLGGGAAIALAAVLGIAWWVSRDAGPPEAAAAKAAADAVEAAPLPAEPAAVTAAPSAARADGQARAPAAPEAAPEAASPSARPDVVDAARPAAAGAEQAAAEPSAAAGQNPPAAPEASEPAAASPAAPAPAAPAPAKAAAPVAATPAAATPAAATPAAATPAAATPAAATPAAKPNDTTSPSSAAPAAISDYGYINVSSSPDRGFDVRVDGKAVGVTPLRMEKVAVGVHSIEIRDAASGRSWVRTVAIEKGKSALVTTGDGQ